MPSLSPLPSHIPSNYVPPIPLSIPLNHWCQAGAGQQWWQSNLSSFHKTLLGLPLIQLQPQFCYFYPSVRDLSHCSLCLSRPPISPPSASPVCFYCLQSSLSSSFNLCLYRMSWNVCTFLGHPAPLLHCFVDSVNLLASYK